MLNDQLYSIQGTSNKNVILKIFLCLFLVNLQDRPINWQIDRTEKSK